jgi:hypothetical protein
MHRNLIAICLLAGLTSYSNAAERRWDIQYQYRQMDSTLTLRDLTFPSAMRGIACGVVTDRKDKDKPVVLVTSDGGEHWTQTEVREAGISLFFLDDSTGWMVTEKGIWTTSESGRTWTKLRNAPSALLKVWFLTREHGYAVGLQKRVFETQDAGASWTPLAIVKDVQGDPVYTTFGEIAFVDGRGIISGWNLPPQKGGPAWMEPEQAVKRRETPHYGAMLQTVDAGKTWKVSDLSMFGQITRISLNPQGAGLGLIEFKGLFEYPSEVMKLNLHNGQSTRAFREKNRAITDVRAFAGTNGGVIAGYEPSGPVYDSPIPGKLKVLESDDLDHWNEMAVDYRAVAHAAFIAGPDPKHLWIGTDTGMILRLVEE